MAIIKELIREEANGGISFGDYERKEKGKVEQFPHNGDLYKVKTYEEITKLEQNGLFLYESVPGTTVLSLKADENGMSFLTEGSQDAQITLGLADEEEYRVFVDDVNVGHMKTNLGGKLSISLELSEGKPVSVRVEKVN